MVSCAKSKSDRPREARFLYSGSDWFEKARRYVEANGWPYRVLSAKHGLLSPTEVVAPYEKSLRDLTEEERRQWGAGVARQIKAQHPDLSRMHFTVLAGRVYRDPLCGRLEKQGAEVDVPMKGLGIGRQLQFLKRENDRLREPKLSFGL